MKDALFHPQYSCCFHRDFLFSLTVLFILYFSGGVTDFKNTEFSWCSHTVLIVAETCKGILRSLMQLCPVANYLEKIAAVHRILNQVKFLSSVNTHHLILCTDRVVKLLKLSGVLSSRLSIKMQFFRLQYQLIKVTITAVFALLSRYKTVNWGLYGIYNIYVP